MELSVTQWWPDHVPPDLVWDHDIREFAREMDDPYLAASRLHDGPELIYARGSSTAGRPGWIATSYRCIVEILQDHESFSSAYATGFSQMLGVNWRLNPLDFDPPEHAAYRRILQPWFQPSAIARLEPAIRAVARELVDSFAENGGCEFVEQFASRFPTRIFMEMMGLPEDQAHHFLALEHGFMRGATPEERVSSAFAIADVLRDLLADRTCNPRDDLPSAILAGRVGDRALNDDERIGMAMLLYIAGLDTVMASSGWHMRYLATHPEFQQRLRDKPGEIPAAVDDLLRAHGVLHTNRTVTRDLVFHGVQLKAGETIMIPTFVPSRDPVQYPDPHVVDGGRKARHVTLSTGAHNCLGIHLARRELTIVLEEFLARFDDIRIPAGETADWQLESSWAVNRLPLRWRRRSNG